jgi:hypothetical protein
MERKSSIKRIAVPIQDGKVIEFVRRQVIGSVVQDENGELDIMYAFFKAVEGDARDHMDSDVISVDHYEMVDGLGKTEVTVTHTPHGMAK